jgi:O-antigen/teichoic acid export membrane protein
MGTARAWILGLNSRLARQSTIYALAGVVVSGLSAVSSAILARGLSTEEFGSYALAISLLTLSALFFEFGLFGPAARLVARADPKGAREVFGGALLLCLPISASFAIFIFATSFFVDGWFDVDIGTALEVLTPLLVAYPLSALLIQIAQGFGRLEVSSGGQVLTGALTIVFLVVAILAFGGLTVMLALLARTLAFLIGTLLMVWWLKPAFAHAREHIRVLLVETRQYGLNIYVGRVLSIGTYNMDVLMLGIWASAPEVGFYALAGALAYIASLPTAGFASALFPRMSQGGRLEPKWPLTALALGALGVVGMLIFAGPVIDVVFGARYAEARDLAVVLAIAQAIRGVTAVYNNYMMATAMGVALRNSALVLTISNVVFNFSLIPSFGAMGAAWASVLALIVNYFARIYYYRREIRMREQALQE